MATPRYVHRAVLLNNGRVLITGGYNNNSGFLAGAELYDPLTSVFTFAGDMTTPRYVHTATLLNTGKVLISGGYADSGSYLGSAELY